MNNPLVPLDRAKAAATGGLDDGWHNGGSIPPQGSAFNTAWCRKMMHGSVFDKRTMAIVPPKSRRRCHCGCKKRATHRGCGNGVTLVTGCQLYIRRWVR